MADKQSRIGGWIKALLGTLAGLLSGAAVMYLSPLVDRVVKPARPLANFAVETDGLTATFHNRFAGEGWWDFGDGSPLEPAVPQEASVSHTYPRPGTYTAKLMVRNFVGDEHERSVGVEITLTSANAQPPAITGLEVIPTSSDRSAPATFRLVAQTANAERCVWDVGGDRPPEVTADAGAKQERVLTFATPGEHVVQVTALNGTQAVKRAVTVRVDPPRADVLVARLRVSGGGTRDEKRVSTEMLAVGAGKSSGGRLKVERNVVARHGFAITDAKLGELDPAFRNMKVEITQGGKYAHITGELAPAGGAQQNPNPPTIPVVLTQVRQVATDARPAEVTLTVGLPGSVVIPLPPGVNGVGAKRSMALEMSDGAGRRWQQPLQTPATYEAQGKRYTITATPVDGGVRLEVKPGTVGLTSR